MKSHDTNHNDVRLPRQTAVRCDTWSEWLARAIFVSIEFPLTKSDAAQAGLLIQRLSSELIQLYSKHKYSKML